jgi:uncharacterized protein YcbK (DUF882 family)
MAGSTFRIVDSVAKARTTRCVSKMAHDDVIVECSIEARLMLGDRILTLTHELCRVQVRMLERWKSINAISELRNPGDIVKKQSKHGSCMAVAFFIPGHTGSRREV